MTIRLELPHGLSINFFDTLMLNACGLSPDGWDTSIDLDTVEFFFLVRNNIHVNVNVHV